MTSTTIEFLDAVKSCTGAASDYSLAPILGVTRAAISKLRNGNGFLGDSTAIRVGELLDIDPAYVVACAHAERAKKDEERAIFQRLAALTCPKSGDRFYIMLSRFGAKLLYKIGATFFSFRPLNIPLVIAPA